jgi:hypothetical protein
MSARAYVIAVTVFAIAVVAILRQVRNRRIRAKYALIWIGAALIFAPIALVPGLVDRISEFVGVAYGPALLLSAGLIFFAWLMLHHSSELSKLDDRTRVLAEEIALLRSDLTEVENEETTE